AVAGGAEPGPSIFAGDGASAGVAGHDTDGGDAAGAGEPGGRFGRLFGRGRREAGRADACPSGREADAPPPVDEAGGEAAAEPVGDAEPAPAVVVRHIEEHPGMADPLASAAEAGRAGSAAAAHPAGGAERGGAAAAAPPAVPE